MVVAEVRVQERRFFGRRRLLVKIGAVVVVAVLVRGVPGPSGHGARRSVGRPARGCLENEKKNLIFNFF